jgi:GNAT superfamily N-acetyltransferase
LTITLRHYTGTGDYWLVDDFLMEHFQAGNRDGNWIEPAWEYMHSHPWLDKPSLAKIGIWEDDGKIVAITHFEWALGEAFFQFHPGYRHLREEMLAYAEENLYGRSEDGKRSLHAYVNDDDEAFTALVKARGYVLDEEGRRPMYQYEIHDPFPPIRLPDGFQLKSLADDCDWKKIDRVLWKGFDHPGEPPEDELEERKLMQDTPNFRHDLKIVTVAPNGDFASFSGTWYAASKRYAYVEPVATDPSYRRLGLGKAAVLEGIRRCAAMGASVAFVGSDQQFYQAIGFKKVYNSECWVKNLNIEEK